MQLSGSHGFVRVLVVALGLGLITAHATPIRFTATGNPNIIGFLEFEGAVFNNTAAQTVSNSNILALSLTVFNAPFTLDDVVTLDSTTVIDSSGAAPRIVDGVGLLASFTNHPVYGSRYLLFKPDGFANTPLDGDAALGYGTVLGYQTHQVRWVPTQADAPEASSIVVLTVGVFLLAWRRLKG